MGTNLLQRSSIVVSAHYPDLYICVDVIRVCAISDVVVENCSWRPTYKQRELPTLPNAGCTTRLSHRRPS